MFGLRPMPRMSFLRTQPAQLSATGSLIPQHELVDEEFCPDYKSNLFYPAKPGEILASCYQLLVKIGWGTRSTVWLARDITRYRWQSERLVALKITNTDISENARQEQEIEKHIAQRNPSYRGRGIVRTYLDSFEVPGPYGRHLCLAYEPMREPLWILQKRFVDRKLPLSVAKAYIRILLAGLDYLHSQCNVVHTDLKLENILMTFENDDILTKFAREQTTDVPMSYKESTGRTVYRCHNNFGPLDWKELKRMIPKITDLGLATRLDIENPDGNLTRPIQPDHYRAPEVILGCGWGCSADIWNFGVLMWNVIEGTELFSQVQDRHGRYDAKAHLAEIIALLGPPPKELLTRSDAMTQYKWPEPFQNDTGKLSWNARQFFDGPFFNGKGQFLHDSLIPDRNFEAAIPPLEEKERQAFLSFVSGMLTWLPERRKTAKELMEHPFLNLRAR